MRLAEPMTEGPGDETAPPEVRRLLGAEPLALPVDAGHNADLGRLLTLFVTIAPLAALLVAIRQLWERQINGQDLTLLATFYLLTGLGICVGFHRLLTHRSFVAAWPVRCCLLALGSMAVEGDAVYWAAPHLEHHARSDRPGDAHRPRDGFWHAHMGWMIGPFTASPAIYARHLRSGYLIRLLALLGLASRVQMSSREAQQRLQARHERPAPQQL